MIGNDENTLEYVKEELKDILSENGLNLSIEYIIVKQAEWGDKDTIKAIEGTINGLDFPCLLVNNYRFYNNNFEAPAISPIGLPGITSLSCMLYQSTMKGFPLSTITNLVGRSFYAMQKSRGVDFEDNTDPIKYQAIDSLVLQKTKSGQKRAMK